MRKSIIITFTLLFVLSISSSVLGAESPFSDVPASHWPYGAIKQLSQAGIVEGYKDGTFRGQNTITRFEMAIISANAMTKIDKVDAAQKAMITKLVTEFAPELKTLNINAASVEKKTEPKISGEVCVRSEWTKNADNKIYTRLRFNLAAPLTDSLTFIGRVEGENTAGTNSDVNVNQSFIVGKALGFDTFLLGRIPLMLGQGLLMDSETSCATRGGADGLILGGGNKRIYSER